MRGLQITPWQEGRDSQCLVSKTHEPALCWLCPWHSEPQLVKWGVGMHREPLCRHSAFGDEEKAGTTVLLQNTGKGTAQSWAWLVVGVGLQSDGNVAHGACIGVCWPTEHKK